MQLQAVAPAQAMNNAWRGRKTASSSDTFGQEAKNAKEEGRKTNAAAAEAGTAAVGENRVSSFMAWMVKRNPGRMQPGIRPSGEKTDTEETDTEETQEELPSEFVQMIRKHIEELFEKIQDGDTEPKFQIGSRAYTLREWEDLLEKYDSIQEAIRQMLREQIEERIERSKESAEQSGEIRLDMITKETVQARFPTQKQDENGQWAEDENVYRTVIDRNGVSCSKEGDDTWEWEILFTEDGQYEKAAEFLAWAGERMDNFRFASNENFWQDFLDGTLNATKFKEFLAGTNNGVPDYIIRDGNSDFIDRDKAQWAKYMNPPGAKLYTAQEMARMVAAEIRQNQEDLKKLSGSYGETYKKYHPEYDGEAIFCEYPGGPLYTADEIGKLMYERAMRDRDESPREK